jgi:hypothetical protein
MQEKIIKFPAPPPLDGEPPVARLAKRSAEDIQEYGILGRMSDGEHLADPKKPRLHFNEARQLVDLPALQLGDMGQPLSKPKTTALVSFRELRASFCARLPPARPVQQMPVEVIAATLVQPTPSPPIEQDQRPESPLFEPEPREPTPDPFAAFGIPTFDQEAWVMEVDPSNRLGGDQEA